MKSIIVINDHEPSGVDTVKKLSELGHQCVLICFKRSGVVQEELKKVFSENDKVWDILVLDIQLGSDLYGGIWVYNHLNFGPFKDRWKDTIVYTQHSSSNIMASQQPSTDFPIKVFVLTAGIPVDQVLQANSAGSREELAKLIDKMV